MSWDSAVIFAGGRSSRMGQDKALLPFGGYDTLSEYQYEHLKKYFGHVYISAKGDKFPFEAGIIEDMYNDSSPMVALASSLESVGANEIFILSVDMPLVDKKLISKLYEKYEADENIEIVISASSNGLEPLCGIYSKKVMDRTKSLIAQGKHRMTDLLDICSTDTIKCDRDEVFANLNTPDDYRKYHKGTYAKH